MLISDFDYELPEDLIAQTPLERRDAARMLLVDRRQQTFTETKFELLPEFLTPDDVLVVNNTRVFPARLMGQREPGGGRVEVLLIREVGDGTWEALVRPAQRLKVGTSISFAGGALTAHVAAAGDKGLRVLSFSSKSATKSVNDLLDRYGQTPLPHYIQRPNGTTTEDAERYQTIFAKERGAVAAPTAGLHFTPSVLKNVADRGVKIVEITLHVGYGTFEPVRVENVAEHHVAAEYYRIEEETAQMINDSRQRGGRVLAVGTTTTRALESAVDAADNVIHGGGATSLTITSGYSFRAVDALLTNFHLPKSSLLLLVSAFAGRDLMLAAYQYAVAKRFRFFSYGDCMFVI